MGGELLLDGFRVPPHARIVVPSRYPGIAMDLTLTHALATPWADIAAAVRELAPADLESFGLRVRYQGAGVPAGAVNSTLGFQYASSERSLTQTEVNDRHGHPDPTAPGDPESDHHRDDVRHRIDDAVAVVV